MGETNDLFIAGVFMGETAGEGLNLLSRKKVEGMVSTYKVWYGIWIRYICISVSWMQVASGN